MNNAAHHAAMVTPTRALLHSSGPSPAVEMAAPPAQPSAQECQRQSRLVAQTDSTDVAMQQWMDECLASVDGWTA